MTATLIESLSVAQAAAERRSIRSYRNEPIAGGDLDAILEITRLAPSAFNAQPWRFVVVTDPTVKAELAKAANGQRQVTAAPAVIVLYTDMADVLATLEDVAHPGMDEAGRGRLVGAVRRIFAGKSAAEREDWGAAQGHIALGYLLLAAESFGYQTSPMAGFDPDAVKRLLSLPDHVRVPALIAIGRGDEPGFPHHRHALARLVRTV